MKSKSVTLCASLWIACLGMQSALAHNLYFLRNSSIAAFTDEDYALMTQNAVKVLSDDKTPAKASWENPQTGSSGTAETLLAFSGPKGEPCKRLKLTNKAGSRHDQASHTLCHSDETGWQLASSDYAPMPKSSGKKK